MSHFLVQHTFLVTFVRQIQYVACFVRSIPLKKRHAFKMLLACHQSPRAQCELFFGHFLKTFGVSGPGTEHKRVFFWPDLCMRLGLIKQQTRNKGALIVEHGDKTPIPHTTGQLVDTFCSMFDNSFTPELEAVRLHFETLHEHSELLVLAKLQESRQRLRVCLRVVLSELEKVGGLQQRFVRSIC